ncbi:UbiA family prenyltransferase [Fulvivirgaceae bacterium BMA12]|uniref:UbiA family prenyltransferase n=1 Tax=Agaribacillus aureus TaxID=3051825 RepID=A0ABT8LEK4_9BACT|nr:UbiA family prenyltransferase [Fulvivirgaceae bacterium BMA12]
MILRSTFLHLRIPFSFFLLPVFLFALALTPNLDPERIAIVFFALHLFLYPASNAYNSYFDKDEKSIGGIKNPPPVSRQLYWISLAFDLLALLLGFMINLHFASMLFIYGLVSKAYSHPAVRIKKYPFLSWFIAGYFQGSFSFLMAYVGLNDFHLDNAMNSKIIFASLLASAILWGSYPMTQIYQHEEDAKRGDFTLSRLLGIKGTFIFTGIVFSLATAGFLFYFNAYYHIQYGYDFMIFLAPVVLFFVYWFWRVIKDETMADYRHTMWLNTISAICMNVFFIYLFLKSSGVLDAVLEGY